MDRSQQPKASTTRTVWDKVYNEAQAKRGETAYGQECASCHAEDHGGGSNAPSLIGGDFSFQWSDRTVGDLFERIRMLMPPDRPNALSSEVYRDIVAFILQSNKYPPGEKELGTELDTLRQILITKARPEL